MRPSPNATGLPPMSSVFSARRFNIFGMLDSKILPVDLNLGSFDSVTTFYCAMWPVQRIMDDPILPDLS